MEIFDAKSRVWGQFGPENKLIEGQPNEYDVICLNASVLAFHLWPTIFAAAPFRLQNICQNGVPPRSRTTTRSPGHLRGARLVKVVDGGVVVVGHALRGDGRRPGRRRAELIVDGDRAVERRQRAARGVVVVARAAVDVREPALLLHQRRRQLHDANDELFGIFVNETRTDIRLTALFRTTQVSRYQKGGTNLDFTEARDSEWQWHQLGQMQVCTLLQTDNHNSITLLSFFTGRMPFLPPNQQRQSTEGTIQRD